MDRKSKDWRRQMEFEIEVNVGAQVYGRLTEKGVKVAKDKGEAVKIEDIAGALSVFSLQISTDQKTLQPVGVMIYLPTAGTPIHMSCVEFELLVRMYERGRVRLVQAVGQSKKVSKKPDQFELGLGNVPSSGNLVEDLQAGGTQE